MKNQILQVLNLIGFFLFWSPKAQAFVAMLRELVEQHWPEFLELLMRTSSARRNAFLKSRDGMSAPVARAARGVRVE